MPAAISAILSKLNIKSVVRMGIALLIVSLLCSVVIINRAKNKAIQNLNIERKNVATLKGDVSQYQAANANQQQAITDLMQEKKKDTANVALMSKKLYHNQNINANFEGLSNEDEKYLSERVPSGVDRMLNR